MGNQKGINYQDGKVYKITSTQTDKIYIGSTCKKYLSQRFTTHKSTYESWKAGKHHYVSSFELMQHEDAQIGLLEAFSCKGRDELRAKETEWMQKLRAQCVNKYLPVTDPVRNAARSKLTKAKYWQAKKEKIKAANAHYRQKNKAKILATDAKYRGDKEKTKAIHARYREKHKEKIKAQQYAKQIAKNCVCGGVYRQQNIARHERTAKHIAFLHERADQTDKALQHTDMQRHKNTDR